VADNTPWPDEQLERLKDMYRAGCYSYEEMGKELNRSRSAVAGKIRRIREEAARKQFAATGVKVKLPRKPAKLRELWFKPIRPAPKAHPHFRAIIKLMNQHQVSRKELCAKVGIPQSTFHNYRTKDVPKLPILEAMYNVFGKELKAVDKND
jgi:hypothetical protein